MGVIIQSCTNFKQWSNSTQSGTERSMVTHVDPWWSISIHDDLLWILNFQRSWSWPRDPRGYLSWSEWFSSMCSKRPQRLPWMVTPFWSFVSPLNNYSQLGWIRQLEYLCVSMGHLGNLLVHLNNYEKVRLGVNHCEPKWVIMGRSMSLWVKFVKFLLFRIITPKIAQLGHLWVTMSHSVLLWDTWTRLWN